MKSDDGTKLIKAWAENLDDVNNIVKNFTPNMARDLIKANNLKSITQKEEAVRTAFQMGITRP